MHGIASGLAKGLAPVLAGLQTYRRGPASRTRWFRSKETTSCRRGSRGTAGGNPPTVSLAPNVDARSVSAISNMTPTLTNVANSSPARPAGARGGDTTCQEGDENAHGEGSLEAFSRPGEGVAVGNATANKSTA